MLTIFHSVGSPITEVEKIKYPYLEYLPFTIGLPFLYRVVNRLFYIFTSKPIFTAKLPKPVDNFYPVINHALDRSNIGIIIHGLAIFRSIIYQQFFTKAMLFKDFGKGLL